MPDGRGARAAGFVRITYVPRFPARKAPPVPVESVFPRLEALLPLVSKPVQYVGGELNAVVKEWDSVAVRWALMYPDAYEVGVPNQGVQILYEVINERDDALAERTYAVWPDMEKAMREHALPAFTVDRSGSVLENLRFGWDDFRSRPAFTAHSPALRGGGLGRLLAQDCVLAAQEEGVLLAGEFLAPGDDLGPGAWASAWPRPPPVAP